MSSSPGTGRPSSRETLGVGSPTAGPEGPSLRHTALPPEASSQRDGGPRKGPPHSLCHHLPQGLGVRPLDRGAQVLVVLEAWGHGRCSDPLPPLYPPPHHPPPCQTESFL